MGLSFVLGDSQKAWFPCGFPLIKTANRWGGGFKHTPMQVAKAISMEYVGGNFGTGRILAKLAVSLPQIQDDSVFWARRGFLFFLPKLVVKARGFLLFSRS